MTELIRKKQTRPGSEKAVVFVGLIIGGIILDALGAYLADLSQLPIYLDVVGTLVASMLGGYVPGIIVALSGTLITMLTSDPTAISYTMLKVIIAIVTSFFYEKGYLRKTQGIMVLMLIQAAVGGILGGIITWLIYGVGTADASGSLVGALQENVGLSPLSAELLGDFLVDISDKAICLFFALTIVFVLPKKFRKGFKIHAWRQAPLSSSVLRDIRKKRSRQASLRIKLVTLLTCAAVIIGASAIYICYIMYFDSTVEHQKLYAIGTAEMAAGMVDGDRIDEYMTEGESNKDYATVLSNLTKIRNSSSFIEYVYVYKILQDGCHVVFDVATEGTPGSAPGEVIGFDESFSKYIPDLLAGGRIDPIITDDKY